MRAGAEFGLACFFQYRTPRLRNISRDVIEFDTLLIQSERDNLFEAARLHRQSAEQDTNLIAKIQLTRVSRRLQLTLYLCREEAHIRYQIKKIQGVIKRRSEILLSCHYQHRFPIDVW